MLDNIILFCIVVVSLTFMEATIAKENNNAPVREDDGPRINDGIRAKEVRFIEPLGEITSRDDTLYEMSGQSIYINGKDVDIFISDADYTYWLENKYEELLR